MYKILIVEDDFVIANVIKKHLVQWDYEVIVVTDFKDVFNIFVQEDPQLILLDIYLPFFNGYYWCSEIRKFSKVPIIFITSASDNMNLVMAVNMGGDDLIAKPFDLDVLTAKVQAIIRRTYSFQGQSNIIEHKGVLLNLTDATLNYKEKRVDLTKNEYKIIQILMENPNKIISRDDIIVKLWQDDSFIDDNTLTVNVTRLRKKLEDIGLIDFIITKKGMGYMVE